MGSRGRLLEGGRITHFEFEDSDSGLARREVLFDRAADRKVGFCGSRADPDPFCNLSACNLSFSHFLLYRASAFSIQCSIPSNSKTNDFQVLRNESSLFSGYGLSNKNNCFRFSGYRFPNEK